jgi:hypothetical protein
MMESAAGTRPAAFRRVLTQPAYQDDFETPGISPFNARLRKHSRQMPNFRKKARGRPHMLQRLCWRLRNLGLRASLTRFAVVAISSLVLR